ncbi:hypothetical protein QR98_0004650 [Sarcoptes scabiei]|nr:hypothetical protein QR98_0004650 [Sarcoptes scabiei]
MIEDLLQFNHDHPAKRARILLSKAKINCFVRDYENALMVLQNQINHDVGTFYYIRSRQIMATIFLNKYKDRKRFIECYR